MADNRPFHASQTVFETDDVQLLKHEIAAFGAENLKDLNTRMLASHQFSPLVAIINQAIMSTAPNVLRYALENGGNVTKINIQPILLGMTSAHMEAIIDIMVAFGWDVDTIDDLDMGPLIYYVTHDEALVASLVNYGADVLKPRSDDGSSAIGASQSTLLEVVARSGGTVSTFELLRSLDVPLGGRELHFACQAAAKFLEPVNTGHLQFFSLETLTRSRDMLAQQITNSMANVRYLIETVGINVNLGLPRQGQRHGITPLGFALLGEPHGECCTELIEYLLDRGADPDLPFCPSHTPVVSILDHADNIGSTAFVSAVEKWQSDNPSET